MSATPYDTDEAAVEAAKERADEIAKEEADEIAREEADEVAKERTPKQAASSPRSGGSTCAPVPFPINTKGNELEFRSYAAAAAQASS